MAKRLRSLHPTFRDILILALFVGLVFLPRLLGDFIEFPEWWLYFALAATWFAARSTRTEQRAARSDRENELAEYAEELGLSFRGRSRTSKGRMPDQSIGRMSGQIDGRNIWVAFSKDVHVRVSVDYGFSDSIWSRSVKRYGGDELLTEDSEFNQRFRIAAGKDEWDHRHAEFKAKYMSDSPHSPIQDGSILDWLDPQRRNALMALDDFAEIERLQWNTIELRLRSEPRTFEDLQRSIEIVMLATRSFKPFDQPLAA